MINKTAYINDLKTKIESLPSGGITVKKISSKNDEKCYEYKVYQWRESGKQHSRYLKDDEVEAMEQLINERKKLEEELKQLLYQNNPLMVKFQTNVFVGNRLKDLINCVNGLKKREIIKQLEDYINQDFPNVVFILYGLRRTGKTTMIKQIINEMDEEHFQKAAYIQLQFNDDLGKVNQDLKTLYDQGYRYAFLDEVTTCNDFIDGSSLLSDIYAASGMKLILSGTDSLGFWISKKEELYNRCILCHTTFIPYREAEKVLGVKGIDTFIEYGGTMTMEGNHYNTSTNNNDGSNIFSSKSDTDEYIDSAIAHNIEHSLKNYGDEGHFRHLYNLYEHHELTSAINRIIEDINHRFTIDCITRDFKSNDLALSRRNLRQTNDILDRIDKDAVTEKLKELLEIKNKNEQIVQIDAIHEKEIKDYFYALDLIKDIHLVDIEAPRLFENKIVFTQPGLRYSQAKSLIEALLTDNIFNSLSFDDFKYVQKRILNKIKGRMLEDIILLETTIAEQNKEVFKLQFEDGEFDMVVFDKENGGCSIYEIKYSNTIDEKQYRHLIDEEKNKRTEFCYGKIKGRFVLYRGENKQLGNVEYLNVEEYLNHLGMNN